MEIFTSPPPYSHLHFRQIHHNSYINHITTLIKGGPSDQHLYIPIISIHSPINPSMPTFKEKVQTKAINQNNRYPMREFRAVCVMWWRGSTFSFLPVSSEYYDKFDWFRVCSLCFLVPFGERGELVTDDEGENLGTEESHGDDDGKTGLFVWSFFFSFLGVVSAKNLRKCISNLGAWTAFYFHRIPAS